MTRSQAARKILAICAVSENGCWIPRRSPKRHGYVYVMASGVNYRAHRLVYEVLVKPIPSGMQIDHLCRKRPCINPLHLEPVTARQNQLRGLTVAARHAAQTHCQDGHPFDFLNTQVNAAGHRHCRECHRIKERQRYWANPEKQRLRKRKEYSTTG